MTLTDQRRLRDLRTMGRSSGKLITPASTMRLKVARLNRLADRMGDDLADERDAIREIAAELGDAAAVVQEVCDDLIA